MNIKVRFRDDWRWYQRGDEVDLEAKLAETLAKELIVEFLEQPKPVISKSKKAKPKSKIQNKPPRDKMLRGGDKRIKKK